MPDFELEERFSGPVFGLDEVGRGPLAGPVVAACVYIPDACYDLPFVCELKDSKKISKPKLKTLYEQITQHFDWSIAQVSVEEIDQINILQASLKAMKLALEDMDVIPAQALVDGNKMPELPCPAECVVKGDSKSYSIAAASIVAKVTRDSLMKRLHDEFPFYSWDTNAGYPSQAHLDGIDQHGITPHHRQSFAPVKNFLARGMTRLACETAA